MADTIAWIKRQADVATSLGILGGGMAAIIVFFGGSIPPWYTPAKAEEAQRQASQIQADTVTALGRINKNLDAVTQRVDRGDCNSQRIQLEQADAGLRAKPSDAMARSLHDSAQSHMHDISGCVK